MNAEIERVRALCVGRHPFLADHLARFFCRLQIETTAAAGLEEALAKARSFAPDIVIAEYELLAMLSLEALEKDQLLSRTAIIAVSLTRRPNEAHLLDVSGVAGFLYLPALDPEAAMRIIKAAAASSRNQYILSPPAVAPAAGIVALTQPVAGMEQPKLSCLTASD